MGTPMRAEIDTPLMVRGTKLRLQDHEVPRSFVAMEVTTAERIVNKGSVAGIYDDAVALGPLPASVGLFDEAIARRPRLWRAAVA